jgi:carbamoyltransferase
MLETCPVRSPLNLPGITHVDGSARPQTVGKDRNPRFATLLEAFFRRTGCPILVNTSFNVRDEPIVCSPTDALFCLMEAELDALVLGSFLIDRASLPSALTDLAAGWQRRPRQAFPSARSPLGENLYSFV